MAYGGRRLEQELRAAFGPVCVRDVPDGWADAWRRFHRPLRIGPLWIGPPWERPPTGAPAVVIDPGRAFGTGAHATTRLCLELLLTLEPVSLVDLGCGSGVLAIAAARLGFEPIVALDDDPAAVEAARANAQANGVELDVRLADCLREPLPESALAVANIGAGAVASLSQRVPAPLLAVSGYLASDRVETPGRLSLASVELDGWAADLLGPSGVSRR